MFKEMTLKRGLGIGAAAVSVISGLLGLWLLVDSRYAHAEQVAQSMTGMLIDTQEEITMMRLEYVDDSLSVLEGKEATGNALTPRESVRKEKLIRYQERLHDRLNSIQEMKVK